MKKNVILTFFCFVSVFAGYNYSYAETSGDVSTSAAGAVQKASQALKALEEGQNLYGSGKFAQAYAVFDKAADLYKDAIENRNEDSFRQNRNYCLDHAALARIKYADILLGKKKFSEAKTLYAEAIEIYKYAERVSSLQFTGNIEYAQYHKDKAQFSYLLETKAPAPLFNLKKTDGGNVRLSDLKGKAVLLEFWASWCGGCMESLPVLAKLYNSLHDEGLAVIGISVDNVPGWDKNTAHRTEDLASSKIPYPVVFAKEKTIRDYGSFPSIPTLYWIDTEGRLFKKVDSKKRSLEDLSADFKGLIHKQPRGAGLPD